MDDDAQVRAVVWMTNADFKLKPYEFKLLAHYRRQCLVSGFCDETVRKTAEAVGFSGGQVWRVRRALVGRGWIVLHPDNRVEVIA